MITFFELADKSIVAISHISPFQAPTIEKLKWLLNGGSIQDKTQIDGRYIGPRASMTSPWSTNAVEITQIAGIKDIARMEKFHPTDNIQQFDPMLMQKYEKLDQKIFDIVDPQTPIYAIEDIADYNQQEGLALNEDEIQYLESVSKRLGRPLTDSEIFGFSQVNSEHCRHKIFNGSFIIDGTKQLESLFQLIKKTSKENPNTIVSAYKDNVAFIEGPQIKQFASIDKTQPSNYTVTEIESILSLKAETHNFPTTVEPFNGAATGSGGEIRDRLAGGQGSIPLAGSAVYMTAYPRFKNNQKSWEGNIPARKWLYQTPLDILIKASNGASDFGNKFGQPLILGSLFTFEHLENNTTIAYDKVIMLAGGVGYGNARHSKKLKAKKGDKIILLGGDNYRIGMGGAAVSSADTGAFESAIELNAVQRSNPEMQKRVADTIKALSEMDHNPIISIHDHGAGGHLNCFSELVEETGGVIQLNALPKGDPTLSAKELIGNESQERMGLIVEPENEGLIKEIAARERAPFYTVGVVTDDQKFTFEDQGGGYKPLDLGLSDLFGNSPKTIMQDQAIQKTFAAISYDDTKWKDYLKNVLQLESVACKDWLTNKVDRCVGGRVAIQQCVGPLQLPLNNCGVMALDAFGKAGIATAIGHAPIISLLDPAEGAKAAVVESLTNIIWAPLKDGLKSVSLSANWMWPCKNPGEDARLYTAVKAISDFAIELGINIPTGKDSLSMAQKYEDQTVLSPGTVVVSAAGHCSDITTVVQPLLDIDAESIYYIDFTQDDLKLDATAWAQTQNIIGTTSVNINNVDYIKKCFDTIQSAIKEGLIVAGHDISAGGIIGCLLELCFSQNNIALTIDLTDIADDLTVALFAENSGIIVQAHSDIKLEAVFNANNIQYRKLGHVLHADNFEITFNEAHMHLSVSEMRDIWYTPSFLFDQHQTARNLAQERFKNYKHQPLTYRFPDHFQGTLANINSGAKPQAAILREKGCNSEREMAIAMYKAGFDVRDVHMTDLINGREDLNDVKFLGAVGGFSNSDVLGSARGWAAAIKYNELANKAITHFF